MTIKCIPIDERLAANTDRSGGPDACWPWQRSLTAKGYGKIGAGGKHRGWLLAHRVAWEVERGPIPDDMDVLHSCDNPPCCNPAHLFLGTNDDNIADRVAKGRSNPARGERSARARLSEDDVRVIRSRFALGGVTQADLAREFGIDPSAISRVVRGRRWSHV